LVVPVKVTDPEPRRDVRVLWRKTMSTSPSIRYVAGLLEETARGL